MCSRPVLRNETHLVSLQCSTRPLTGLSEGREGKEGRRRTNEREKMQGVETEGREEDGWKGHNWKPGGEGKK